MQLLGNAKIRVGLFAVLALGSLGLKAAVGPPRDSLIDRDPRIFEQSVSHNLRSQNFSTTQRSYAHRSTLILATRGSCRIAVRDAKWGSGVAPVFAEDAREIGPVYYLYRGHRYSSPPGMLLRWGRLEYEMLDRFGVHSPIHALVAFAASPGCRDSRFGLADLRIGS